MDGKGKITVKFVRDEESGKWLMDRVKKGLQHEDSFYSQWFDSLEALRKQREQRGMKK